MEVPEVEAEGFQTLWSKKGRQGRGRGRGLGRSHSFDHGRGGGRSYQGRQLAGYLARTYGSAGEPPWKQSGDNVDDITQGIVSNPKYFKRFPSGDFENEQYEDANDWEEEMDDEELKLGKSPEKREALAGDPQLAIEDGKQKKGRFEPSGETLL